MIGPVRSLAFYGFLGSGNLGNDASLETVLAWFRSAYPEVELRCITLAPEVVRARYGVGSVRLTASARGIGSGRFGSLVAKVIGRLKDLPRSFALAGSADAVVVPGMGVLEETLGVRPWGLPSWMFLMAAACRIRRRPFVLLAVGAEPIRNRLTRCLFVLTVRLATHVSYRDEWSAQSMRDAGGRVPEAVTPDVAFCHPMRTVPTPEAGCVVVGVMAYYGQHDDPVLGANIRRRYVATMAQALIRLVDDGDRIVLLGGDRVDVDIARAVEAAVRAERPNLSREAMTVRDVETFDDLAVEMARAEVVVASRFHNLICALRLAQPSISIGYAEKNTRLMRELGLAQYCQDIEALDAERLVRQVRQARAEREYLVATIGSGTQRYAVEVRSLLDQVAQQALRLPRVESAATAV